MEGMWRDQDRGYSSLEDEDAEAVEHSAEHTPAMVIDAALARLRARAGCQEDSFVRQLSTSLLSRMARNLFKDWVLARCALEDGEQTEMPDFMEMVTEQLRRFAQRKEITEEYNRRNSRGSVEHDELEEQRRRERGDYLRSPRRRLSHSRSMDDPALDLDILQPVLMRSSPDSPISPTKGLTDPEELRSFQRIEPVRVRRRTYSRHLVEDAEREERRRLRRLRRSVEELESSQSPEKTELQKSDAIVDVLKDDLPEGGKVTAVSVEQEQAISDGAVKEEQAISDGYVKEEQSIADGAVKEEQATVDESVEEELKSEKAVGKSVKEFMKSEGQASVGEDVNEQPKSVEAIVDHEEDPKCEEQPLQGAEGSVSPGESRTTPSDEFLTSVEDNIKSGEAELETGTRPKTTQKDKERCKRRTRKVIESFSNRQITRLRNLSITRMDALEMIIQLSVSMDRLDRLINGSRATAVPDVDETILAEFLSGLEISRTRETANRISAAGPNESLSSWISDITEQPYRDPRGDDA